MVLNPTKKVRMDLRWRESLMAMEIMPWDYFMVANQLGVIVWKSFKGGFVTNIGYQKDMI
jgi:hypothetical protein